jgi:LacI family transcriptional regulator
LTRRKKSVKVSSEIWERSQTKIISEKVFFKMNLEDIARKAGVSRSTVSRVINQDRYVSDLTRERVMAVIQQERFHPHAAARALVTRRTQIISVVITNDMTIFFGDNTYFPMLLQGISEGLLERDYAMLLWLGQADKNADDLVQRVSRHHLTDGLIVPSLKTDHPLMPYLMNLQIPIVMVDRPIGYEDRLSYVTVDNVTGAQQLVRHLIQQSGRRRIAHITGIIQIADAQDRLEGYRRALEEAGLPYDERLVYEGTFTRQAGYEGVKTLLHLEPDAIFAASDASAVGAIRAINEAGLRVPEDIAVVGFDDVDIAQSATPRITTMQQPVQQKGAAAARMLLDHIEGKITEPQHVVFPTELVVRQSCGAVLTQSLERG